MEQKVPENGINESVETTTVEAPKKKLTKIEKKKLRVINKLIEGEINGTQAAKKLKLSTRQIRNLKRQVLNEGVDGVIHKNKNYKPYNTYDSEVSTFITKLYRKEYEVSKDGLRQLTDIAGIRVICKYVDDIYYIAQLLLLHDDITLVKKTNYIQYPKDNGYRSFYSKEGVQLVPVEIQIRTIAMDMWASLEHNLRYKSDHEVNDDIKYRLKKCAEDIAATDLEMQNIYRELNSKWKKK